MPRPPSAPRQRRVLLPGLLGALLLALLAHLGVFDPFERRSIDARFRLAQPHTVALSDQIRLVDIDDGAIESVGRWPWKRSVLADALDELTRAGARTVAFDLLLDDPSEPEWVAGAAGETFTRADHDAALARALADAHAVLAVDAPFEMDAFQTAATTTRREIANTVFRHFRADLSRPFVHPDGLFLYPDIRLRRIQHLAALALALEHRAALPTTSPDDLADLVRVAAPSIAADTGRFAERSLLERAATQAHSLAILSSRAGAPLPTRLDLDDAIGYARVTPPQPALAQGASAFGFVNFAPDPDDAVRRMRPTRVVTDSLSLPQFGLAAAAAYRDEDPATAIRVASGSVETLGRSIPLRDGRMLISWPSHRAHRDRAGEQRLSIGVCASLAENRRTLDRLVAQRRAIVASINDVPEDSLTDRSFAAAAELSALRMDEFREILDEGVELSAEELEYIAPYERFTRLQHAIESGEREIAQAQAELRRRVEGRLCFVGWNASGAIADFVPTPLGARTPGVDVHATLADMALTGRAKALAPGWFGPFFSLAMGVLAALLVASLPTSLSLLGLLAIASAWLLGAGYAGFRSFDLAMPLVGPLVSLVSVWGLTTALDAAASRADRLRISRQFKARVAPQLVDRLAANPDALAVDGQQREITVLFLDVAGFTALSEKLDGPQTVATINECMRAFTGVLTKADAYVNKFLGDGLMAFWSAFDNDASQADKAVAAAGACLDAIETVNAHRRERDPDAMALSVRVGVATGVAVVGDCGAPPELNDYTAIGNAVNLAARLESACKAFGAKAMIDGRTRELMKQPPARTLRRLGRVVVIGQSVPVEIFELRNDTPDEQRASHWATTLGLFEAANLDDCLRALDEHLARFGRDDAADRLRDAIEDLREGDDPLAAPLSIRLRSK
ncbi:MAG: adenylate/guanylate cyclase domain-containing protein [Phycisphaeraceae bacterium]|nr:adenylate/guanylate cyclase domain-containing protein [Phycisphaeraceae bacterium]